MKRFFILLFIIPGFWFFAEAQELTPEILERRLSRSDSRIEHPRRGENPRTWVDRGILFQDIFDVNIQFLYFGMAEDELLIFMGEPKETRTAETETGIRNIKVYENIEVYFENGELTGWKETKVLHESPLAEAYEAFKKAIELEASGRQESRIEDAYTRLSGQFVSQAVLYYEERKFSEAFDYFKNSVEIAESPYYQEELDEGLVYNTGFVATLAEKHQEALKFYEKAKDLGYDDPNLYVLMKESYLELGDSTKAELILREAFEAYPEDNVVLVEMVNFYINADNAEAALDYLKLAKEQEPENASFHYAEGTLYERTEEIEKAKEAYQRSIELNPDFFDVNYNMGVLHYNEAVRLLEEANELTDNIEYANARDHAFEVLAKATPYLEQAHSINPEDEYTMETLRIIYYRLDMDDKLEEMNKKLGREPIEE